MDIDHTTKSIILSFPEQIMTGLPECIPVSEVPISMDRITELERISLEQADRYAQDSDPDQRSLVYGVERKVTRLRQIMKELLMAADILTGGQSEI